MHSQTGSQTGLKVRAKLDSNSYPPGAKVSKKQIAEVNIRPDSFHGEWNYNSSEYLRYLIHLFHDKPLAPAKTTCAVHRTSFATQGSQRAEQYRRRSAIIHGERLSILISWDSLLPVTQNKMFRNLSLQWSLFSTRKAGFRE